MKDLIILIAAVFVSLGIRSYSIEQKNLWFDEVYSWKISQGDIVQIVSETSGDIHPPLYYVILKWWISIFSDSIFSMRMLSVLSGVISVVFVYLIARLFLTDRLQIIFVLLMYAFSPLNIFYSQEVRMLNLNLFLCLIGVYCFFRFLEEPVLKFALPYVLATILSLYTHYFAFLILLAEVIIVLMNFFFRGKDRHTVSMFTICFVVVNILYLPWYPTFFRQVAKGQPWRTMQSLPELGSSLFKFFNELFMSQYYGFEPVKVYYLANLTGMLLIVLLTYFLFRLFNKSNFYKDKKFYITLFFFIPLAIAILISSRQSIVFSRYLSIIVPYFCITIVLFSFSFFKKKIAMAVMAALTLLNAYGAVIYFNNDYKNNDYRRVISYVEKNFSESDKIIVEPHFMGWVFNYHILHSDSKLARPEILGWNINMQLDSLKKRSDLNRVWFITDYSSLDSGKYSFLDSRMSEMGFEQKEKRAFYLMPAKVKVEYFVRNN